MRRALGYDSIALFGVSYGTKLALAYALAHPDHVERLLLDSVSLPEGDNPFLTDFFAKLPKTLARFCAGSSCRGITGNLVGDVATVANALATKPARGEVVQPGGGRHPAQLGGNGFLSLVVEADLNPAIAAQLPAVTHAARHGDPAPLLRLWEIAAGGRDGMYPSVNLALFLATTCRDGPFPWTPETPLGARPQDRLRRARGAARRARSARSALGQPERQRPGCVGWPSPKGGAALGSRAAAGRPRAGAQRRPRPAHAHRRRRGGRLALPQGHLLVAPGTGHSVLSDDVTGCAVSAVHDWLAAVRCRRAAPRSARTSRRSRRIPRASAPATPAGHGRTLELVGRTLREAEATWLLLWLNDGHRAAGPRGGTLTNADDSFTLSRYTLFPGVQVSGKVSMGDGGPPLRFSGLVEVAGAGAAAGTAGSALSGRLEGMLGGGTVGN